MCGDLLVVTTISGVMYLHCTIDLTSLRELLAGEVAQGLPQYFINPPTQQEAIAGKIKLDLPPADKLVIALTSLNT